MLIKLAVLEAIREGTVSLAFRKWKRPAVKTGSLIKTAVGLVSIGQITLVQADQLNNAQAVKAGYKNLEALLKALVQIPEGDIYKIPVSYHAEDPRIALRQQAALSSETYLLLKTKLDRLDKYSRTGSWTLQILQAIQQYPLLIAADLALKTGKEKDWLKLNIRKLKNLGLTISHDPGYEVSPLGKAYLETVSKDR